jgi:cysteine desulfurase
MDYSAGKPVDHRILETMMPYFKEKFGNPSSPHSFGQDAFEIISDAREKIAKLVSAEKFKEIVFTSGGTESNNLAIKGTAFRNKNKGNHIITSSIEHMSVINTCNYLRKHGFEISFIPVDKNGVINTEELCKKIKKETILVSIMYANGEIGTVEPIREIGEITQDKNIIFHVDAVAAADQVKIDVQKENIDLLSISSNDMYGPRGVGSLYVRSGTPIQPELLGGGQEYGLRSGTENLPGIAGFGKAAEILEQECENESSRLTKLRDKLIKNLIDNIPESYLNGHPSERLSNNINIRFNYVEGEALILSLDMEGVQCSSGSACTSKTLQPSHVLLGIGLKHEEAHGSLLLTLGRKNIAQDILFVSDHLPNIVKRLRKISPLTPKDMID